MTQMKAFLVCTTGEIAHFQNGPVSDDFCFYTHRSEVPRRTIHLGNDPAFFSKLEITQKRDFSDFGFVELMIAPQQ
ncbi:MAG: hypothetical protein JNIBNLAF_02156 [Nitrosomonas europaea]|nr:hypothetical protein [Nitrosomonas europaea]